MRWIFILMLLACTGCAEVQYLDQALTLKGYSDEKDAQKAYVQAQDARFDQMLQQARTPDTFRAYQNKAAFSAAFGDPVFCRSSGDLEECLYRRIFKPSESPKIYLYFNAKGGLVRWHGESL
jgi:hypothetical protein